MSHKEYIEKCDEDQLNSLIEHANQRLTQIKQSGWVKLWTVSVGWANVAWFEESDYAAAVARASAEVGIEAARRPNTDVNVGIELERFRPEEVAGLLKRTKPLAA